MRVFRLQGMTQNYAWGTTDEIPRLLGRIPDDQPVAEYWLGAHPKAPSVIVDDGTSLADKIASDPDGTLGRRCRDAFGDGLPFLFKLLSAETPLSIQCHPNRAEARAGFLDENARGIALDAPDRNYKDDGDKPELLVALTPFVALKGFRAPAETARLLRKLVGAPGAALADAMMSMGVDAALQHILQYALTVDGAERRSLLDAIDDAAKDSVLPEAALLRRVRALYDDDATVLAALFLRLVVLAPGEGIFLGPGELHAYVEGTGLELMGSSDNVLRGGLTPKHIDRDELLRVCRFVVDDGSRLHPTPVSMGHVRYDTPSAAVSLHVVETKNDMAPFPVLSPSIVFVLDGELHIEDEHGTVSLQKGESAFVSCAPGGADRFSATFFGGKAKIALATVVIDDEETRAVSVSNDAL